MMEEMLSHAAYGAMASFMMAGAGYFKNSNNNGSLQTLDAKKFLKTVILGAIVGGGAGFFGVTPEVYVAMPMYAGVEAFVERGLKALFRRLS